MEFEITDYELTWESISDDAYRGGRYVNVPTITTNTAKVSNWDTGEISSVGRKELTDLFGHQAVNDAEEVISFDFH